MNEIIESWYSLLKNNTSVFDLPKLIDAYDNDILFLFEGLLRTYPEISDERE